MELDSDTLHSTLAQPNTGQLRPFGAGSQGLVALAVHTSVLGSAMSLVEQDVVAAQRLRVAGRLCTVALCQPETAGACCIALLNGWYRT